jgi:Ca2+-binding RTX toxin-like protein
MATILGTKFNDILVGTSTDDLIKGGDGADIIVAGGGNDTIVGGKGADFISGGDGIDLISYSDSDAAVNVNLATHVGKGGTAEGDFIIDVENLNGSKFNDTLIGDAGANVINGGGGDDQIHGGGGADELFGGNGNDTLFSDTGFVDFDGGIGNDTADFSGRTNGGIGGMKGIYVDLKSGWMEYDGPYHKGAFGHYGMLVSIENISGTEFKDTIIGDTTGNVLKGNGGNDVLTGNGGSDTFVYDRHNGTVDFGNDTITDYSAGYDHVQLDHTIFANYAAVQAHMQQVGNDVVITYDANDSITLHDVQLANLHASDFVFV